MNWFKRSQQNNYDINQAIQIAEDYLANEKLPYLKSTTTGKAFNDRYYDADDIISDAIVRTLSVIRNPETWKNEKIIDPQTIKKRTDRIINWIIRNVSYNKAGDEITKRRRKKVPLELANTDFDDNPVDRLTEEDITLSTNPEYRFIREEEQQEINDIMKKLQEVLSSDPQNNYFEVLQYFLPLYDETKTGKNKRRVSEILNGADKALGRRFTLKDSQKMVDLIETNIGTKYPLIDFIIKKLRKIGQRAWGDYYRKPLHNMYETDIWGERKYIPRKKQLSQNMIANNNVNWFNKISALDWDIKYPLAESTIDGLTVGENIPNMSSIEASLTDYEILDGIRKIPMWDSGGAKESFYSSDDIQKTLNLAKEIKRTRRIDPLIVEVNDQDDLSIIEGNHRLAALVELKVNFFPAIVVVDLENSNELV